MDVVTEYSLETSVTIFDVPVNNHILLFTSKTSDNFNIIYESYESTALEFRGQIIFVLVDTDEPRNGRLFEYFRITEVDTPAVRILNITSDIKYRMPADDVSPLKMFEISVKDIWMEKLSTKKTVKRSLVTGTNILLKCWWGRISTKLHSINQVMHLSCFMLPGTRNLKNYYQCGRI
ncbi:unnamed protein product [Staurois parvus]|uniref:Uncharacterized protein n=1 Tax=Staurois parvus TaxID=386267 RepID=A0ABN9H3P2_9NEOB|nr:unnamed protein product [Staurois parvus]